MVAALSVDSEAESDSTSNTLEFLQLTENVLIF